MIEGLKLYLSSNQTVLNLIHEAPSLAKARYDASSNSSRFSSQIQTLRSVVELLELEVYREATRGNVPKAVEAILRNLDIVQSLDNRIGVNFPLYRRHFTIRILTSLQWLMCRHSLTETELMRLQQEFAQARRTRYRDQLFSGLQCYALDYYREQPDPSARRGKSGRSDFAEKIRRDLIFKTRTVTGANERDLLGFLDALQQYTHHLGQSYLQLYRKTSTGRNPTRIRRREGFPFDAAFPFQAVVCPLGEQRALCQLAITALAIERYRLHHAGQLPGHLSDLVPDYLAPVLSQPQWQNKSP
jgi:hypothetical protein